jgi:hypothetical protein
MPCWTVTETTTDLDALGKVDEERIREAARLCGYQVRRIGGKLEAVSYSSRAPDLNAIKRQYASLTVQAAAKRFGWKAQSQQAKGSTLVLKLGR